MIDIGIGIQDHRQMLVCIRCAYCPKLDKLMMFNDKEDIAMLQSGHLKAIEDKLYGVSARYLGQLLENIVKPFAMANAKWQRMMDMPKSGKIVNLNDFPVHNT